VSTDLNLSVRMQRDFNAPVARVFEAWRDPEFITRWWKNLEVAELDFREGGAYRFEWASWDGHVEGTYETIRQNEEIAFTWNAVPSREGAAQTLVRLRFEALDEARTRLHVEHELNRTVGEHDGHQEGWTASLRDLASELGRAPSGVAIRRVVDAPPERVFRALTEGPEMERWFFTTCRAEAHEGGRLTIEWESVDEPSRNHRRTGRFLSVVPDRELVFEWGGLALDGDDPPSTTVHVSLSPHEGGTELVLEHTGWGDSAEWTESRDRHESGWSFYVANLVRHLTGGPDLRTTQFGQRTASAASTRADARPAPL